MLKKFTYLSLFLLFISLSAKAIDWVDLTTPLGKSVALDKDSIIEADGNYFYNIKYKNAHNSNYTVVTIQSGILHPFSSRIKFYSLDEYVSLKGDYKNIALNKTTSLEAVTYDSVVGTCYREVKNIKRTQNIPSITLK